MKICTLSPSTKSQLLAALSANIIAFSHGAMLGWMSPFIPLLQSDQSPLPTGKLTVEEVSWIGAVVCIGGFTGNFLFSFLGEKLGRKKVLLLLCLPQIGFWLSIKFATSVWFLYMARIFGGTGGGGIFLTVPLYINEIAEADHRGGLGSLLLLCLNCGTVLSFTISLFIDYSTFPLIMMALPIIFFITFSQFPETPQDLIRHKKIKEAEISLKYYRGITSKSECPKEVYEEFERIKHNVQNSKKKEESQLHVKDFFNKEAATGLTISMVLMVLNQFSGGFVIINYTETIFRTAGSSIEPRYASIIIAVIQICGTYSATMLVDRVGRKILLIISCIGTSAGLITLGLFSYFYDNGYEVQPFAFIPLLSLSVVIYLACLGLLTLPFVIMGEVLPGKIRSIGSSVCLGSLTMISFLVLKMFPIIMENFGLHGCFWIFGGVCAAGTIFVVLMIPETKGKILDAELSVDTNSTTPRSRRTTIEIKVI